MHPRGHLPSGLDQIQAWNSIHVLTGRGEFASASQEIGNRKIVDLVQRGCFLAGVKPPDLRGGANGLFSFVLICTTSRRFPASASTRQEPEKGDLIAVFGLVGAGGAGVGAFGPPDHRAHLTGVGAN